MTTEILKSLVGSRAHNLHTEDSDYDWRGVFIQQTKEILSLNHKPKPVAWIEGKEDETSYEIGHFLHLCTKANPSVLEVLVSTETKINTYWADEMRQLMPYMYDPQDAFNAFAGYSKNQQKKLLENHLDRKDKFGVAYVRTAWNLYDLFSTGAFTLEVKDEGRRQFLLNIKSGNVSSGEIIDRAEKIISEAKQLLPTIENKQDLGAVNDFLLNIRKGFWT